MSHTSATRIRYKYRTSPTLFELWLCDRHVAKVLEHPNKETLSLGTPTPGNVCQVCHPKQARRADKAAQA